MERLATNCVCEKGMLAPSVPLG